MGRREYGGIGRFFIGLLIFCLVLALGATVAYLMSERNQRHYRMRYAANTVLIERGRLLPYGYEPFVPEAKDLQTAYAPIAVPPNERVAELESFEDRVDLDRALFALLAGWARTRLQAGDAASFDLANGYVTRCSLLPGLSEEQRSELKSLRADLAYRNGRRMAASIADDLDKALAEFRLALELGTSRPNDARDWAAIMEKQAIDYRAALRSPTEVKPEGAAADASKPAKPTGEAL